MDIVQKFCKIPLSKNVIREWPNESEPKYFQLICQTSKFVANFFDNLSDGYNVEMLIKYLFMNRFQKNFAKISS